MWFGSVYSDLGNSVPSKTSPDLGDSNDAANLGVGTLKSAQDFSVVSFESGS